MFPHAWRAQDREGSITSRHGPKIRGMNCASGAECCSQAWVHLSLSCQAAQAYGYSGAVTLSLSFTGTGHSLTNKLKQSSSCASPGCCYSQIWACTAKCDMVATALTLSVQGIAPKVFGTRTPTHNYSIYATNYAEKTTALPSLRLCTCQTTHMHKRARVRNDAIFTTVDQHSNVHLHTQTHKQNEHFVPMCAWANIGEIQRHSTARWAKDAPTRTAGAALPVCRQNVKKDKHVCHMRISDLHLRPSILKVYQGFDRFVGLLCLYVYVHAWTYVCIVVFVYLYVSLLHEYVSACMHVECMCLYVSFVCVYVCARVYIFVWVVCVCMYIHTRTHM